MHKIETGKFMVQNMWWSCDTHFSILDRHTYDFPLLPGLITWECLHWPKKFFQVPLTIIQSFVCYTLVCANLVSIFIYSVHFFFIVQLCYVCIGHSTFYFIWLSVLCVCVCTPWKHKRKVLRLVHRGSSLIVNIWIGNKMVKFTRTHATTSHLYHSVGSV